MQITEEIGLDPRTMDEAVTAGLSPDWVGMLWGDYDLEAVESTLADRGVSAEEVDSGTRWTSGKDHEVDLANGPFSGVVPTNEFNSLRTAAGSFAYAPARSALDWVTVAGDRTLADEPGLAQLADCLGDVVAAAITTPKGSTTTYAVGVRVLKPELVVEVACLLPHDPDQVGPLRDRVAAELADGTVPSTQQPWSELLPKASVKVADDSAVRVTVTPPADEPVGRMFQMLRTSDLAALVEAG